MSNDLRAVVIVDYQNVHLTGHNLFEDSSPRAKHESLIDPLRFGQRLIVERNSRQSPGYPQAVLRKVHVFRGQPSPEHDASGYGRSQAQRAQWQRDKRVTVTLRPLKYEYLRASDGQFATDDSGRKIVVGQPREKGIDVLCALAAVREAQDPSTDLLILASSDSDLAPVLDEVRRISLAKIETCCWWNADSKRGFQLHPLDRTQPVWNTRLPREAFVDCRDYTSYA